MEMAYWILAALPTMIGTLAAKDHVFPKKYHDSRRLNGVSRALNGLSRNLNGVSRDLNGLSRDLNGVSRDLNGLSRDLNGVFCRVKGLSRTLNGVHGGTGPSRRQSDLQTHHRMVICRHQWSLTSEQSRPTSS